MGFKARRNQAAEDTETVARVRGTLETYLAQGGRDTMVSVPHVLDLLDPRGLWQFDPERRKAAPAPVQAGEGDPLTGARWAGPAGTTPPED